MDDRRTDSPTTAGQARSLRTAALALLVPVAVVACGVDAGVPSCAPAEVLATEAGPEDEVEASGPDVDAGELGETRLVHEQDGFAFYLVEPAEHADVCLWIEQGDDFVSQSCGGSPIFTSAASFGVHARYDVRGDVAADAGSDWTVVNECLAVST